MLSAYFKDDSGATAIEYGLIAALIAISIVVSASAVGGSISGSFEFIKNKLD